ncbi:c-type cytochrome [Sinimarinibacterium thermocellulolyticum]|uniref:C-type cytochrome n=1 Tax=Sinimarinibacterium thermocellulolyticum TaxID=3170016 RepID=A0ABV2A881_9GAMM
MKRVLLAAFLCAPLFGVVAAPTEATGTDPFTQGSAEAGAAKAAPCAACHGPGGNSSNPEWPKLAGQNARYTFEQLQHFKNGVRKNPLMAPQAAGLSERDMRDLAVYFAQQPASPGVASENAVARAEPLYRGGDAKRGIPACAACHLPDGAGVAAAGYPRIGGQHARYTAVALRRLRAEHAAASEPLPGNLGVMAAVAAKLSDEDIDALASYINGLQ